MKSADSNDFNGVVDALALGAKSQVYMRLITFLFPFLSSRTSRQTYARRLCSQLLVRRVLRVISTCCGLVHLNEPYGRRGHPKNFAAPQSHATLVNQASTSETYHALYYDSRYFCRSFLPTFKPLVR